MSPRVALRAAGRVELPAYGLGDAEHRVEKELHALWPGARVEVLEVIRSGEARLVEEFALSVRLIGSIEVPPGAEDPSAAALREARSRLSGTRYARLALEPHPE